MVSLRELIRHELAELEHETGGLSALGYHLIRGTADAAAMGRQIATMTASMIVRINDLREAIPPREEDAHKTRPPGSPPQAQNAGAPESDRRGPDPAGGPGMVESTAGESGQCVTSSGAEEGMLRPADPAPAADRMTIQEGLVQYGGPLGHDLFGQPLLDRPWGAKDNERVNRIRHIYAEEGLDGHSIARRVRINSSKVPEYIHYLRKNQDPEVRRGDKLRASRNEDPVGVIKRPKRARRFTAPL